MSGTPVCNEALALIGQSVITDINSTTSDTARSCKLLFEQTAREVMRSYPCNSQKRRFGPIAQNVIPSTEDEGWDYSYTVPTDCVRVVTVNGHTSTSNYKEDYWELEGRNILTDADSCFITYIQYSDDTPLWDSLLRACVAKLLASKLATKLGQDDAAASRLLQEYLRVDLPKAQRVDGNERRKRPYSPIGDSPWIHARRHQPG